MLTAEEVERFVSDGFVYLPGAFPRALADECRAFLWRETGVDPDDPATWTKPVIRLPGYGGELFNAAANTPALHEAFDQLVGAGRWVPRDGLGTFPVRFPHPDDPGDAGWHMEGSYTVEGEQGYWLNLRSRFMAQPPLTPVAPLDLRRADGACSPVELAVLRGLGDPPSFAERVD